jgi:hypothetical protein
MATGLSISRIWLALTVCGAQFSCFAQTATPAVPPAPPAVPAPAQAPTTAPDAPSPGAIFKDAMRPLDVVRGSMDNWSDAELGALAVGMHKAHEACAQAKPVDYTGDDLYDLARLCSFGQDWNDANTAASRYLDTRADPHRAQAYALSMNALVHLNGVDLAVQTARAMLRGLPYDAEVAYAIRFMKDYLEQAGNPEAVSLASAEHAAIVQALAQDVPLKAAHGDAVMSVGALFDSAMELAFWQHYAGDDRAASSTVTDVEGALQSSTPAPVEDQPRIAARRQQYQLLGTRLPELKIVRSLQSAKAKLQIDPEYGAATVLVIFPDWCTQCRKMMTTVRAFANVNSQTPIHAYGLMFAEGAETPGEVSHEDAAKGLQGTPTLEVAPELARSFGAIDCPLAVVVDKAGMIRFIGPIPGDAFNGNGYMEKVILRMAVTRATPKASAKEN